MDGGVWWATVHGASKSQTRLSDGTHTRRSAFPGFLSLGVIASLKLGVWACLVAQGLKRLPAMRETQV